MRGTTSREGTLIGIAVTLLVICFALFLQRNTHRWPKFQNENLPTNIRRGTMEKEPSGVITIAPAANQDLTNMIQHIYSGGEAPCGRIHTVHVGKITINGDDITVEVALEIYDAWSVNGTFHLELTGDNVIAHKLRQMIASEDDTD